MAKRMLSTILLCLVLAVVLFCGSAQGYVMPYPGDCTKYQQCDISGCFVLSCGAGTEFNPNIGTCDYPLADRTNCANRY
ncbi:putative chitinase 10 [Calliopsis andreniformis]|uniref:putative chitinase 10 n=1 Tax=Calliopsis andreniformis TaxID=337506 RepID=UPI003FCC85C2